MFFLAYQEVNWCNKFLVENYKYENIKYFIVIKLGAARSVFAKDFLSCSLRMRTMVVGFGNVNMFTSLLIGLLFASSISECLIQDSYIEFAIYLIN